MQEKWLPGNTMDRIRGLCRSRNITQVELAQAVGMDKSTLSRVMAEKTSKLSSKNLVAIANYFEVGRYRYIRFGHSEHIAVLPNAQTFDRWNI